MKRLVVLKMTAAPFKSQLYQNSVKIISKKNLIRLYQFCWSFAMINYQV